MADEVRPRRRVRRLVLRGLRRLVLLVILLFAAGYIFEAGALRRDQERYPPLGEHLIVDEREIHIFCIGSGDPTVILEAGEGLFSLSWQLVQPEAAKITRVCSYDRAGLGWSQANDTPRTPQNIIAELRALLQEANIRPPYVLVGHSIGGRYARVFTAEYPDEVAGLVLVDAINEDYDAQYPVVTHEAVPFWNYGFALQFGVVRLFGPQLAVRSDPDFAQMPTEDLRSQMILMYRSYRAAVALSEIVNRNQADGELYTQGSLGNLPLSVLVRGRPMPEADRWAAWQVSQQRVAGLSTHGKLVVADGSGPNILYAQPDLVIEAIRRVVTEARLR